MKETGKNQEIDNLIAEEMRKAFGYDNESLIAEFDRAAEEMDDADRIPPEGEFDKIMATARKRASKKVVRLKRLGKIGLLVAILGCMLMGTGIGASGKRAYEYNIKSYAQGQSSIWNNAEFIETGNETDLILEDAYQKIKDELGIESLQLVRLPEGMGLTKLSLGEGYARMEFTQGEKYVYFVQSQYPVESSGSTTSDCGDIENVNNKALDMNLKIKKDKLSNKKIEYSTEFAIDKTYYYLIGTVTEDEFIQIIKRINN